MIAAGPRLHCCVPYCRHTRGSHKNDPLPADVTGWEWICATHWRPVPRTIKARRRQLDRRVARLERAFDLPAYRTRLMTTGRYDAFAAAMNRARAAARQGWATCRDTAIEIAMGIGA